MTRPNHLLLSALAFALISQAAIAQTRSTAVIIGVSNIDYASEGLLVSSLYSQDNPGGFTSGSAGQSFEGNNRSGDASVMTLNASGFGSSDFGRLRTYTSLTLENAFYNSENTPYVNSITEEINTEGTPDFFDSFAAARFTDTLQYGGQLQSGYRARYFFNIHGNVSGNASAGAALQVQVAENEPEYISYSFAPGEQVRTYATQTYAINGTFAQNIKVDFGTATSGYTQSVNDGDTIFGIGDFSSTTTLAGIEVTDAAGNIISGYTLTSASGTSYPVAPVPEPASMMALALGGIALLSRRRRK